MANKKLSQLTTVGSLNDTDIIPVVDGSGTKKVAASVIKTYATSGLSTVATSGDYADLTNKPTIPVDISDLTDTGGLLPVAAVESYKGFKAHYGSMYNNNDDPNGPINKIVIYKDSVSPTSTIDESTGNDNFTVTELLGSDVVAMLVTIGNNIVQTPTSELKTFAESIIDNVILDGGVEGNVRSAVDMKTAFYDNFATFSATVSDLKPDLQFFDVNNQFNLVPNFETGKGATFNGLRYNMTTDAVESSGWGQGPGTHEVGDIFVIPGNTIQDANGNFLATPDNDITITLTTAPSGYIGEFTVSGTLPRPAETWPSNNINDGGSDEYDGANYIDTNFESQISYNDGNVVSGSSAFGGGDYVVTYQDSIFGVFAVNTTINSISTSGNSGFDGEGQAETGALYSAAAGGTGDITFDGVKIIGSGTASGDGSGYGTIELVPANSLYATSPAGAYGHGGQYLVIDPTSPQHIHIRAGGPQDQAAAQLILGGEKANVTVRDQNNSYNEDHSVTINTFSTGGDSYSWEFASNGDLRMPSGGDIKDSSGNSIVVSSMAEPRFDLYANTLNIGTIPNRRYAVDTTLTPTTIYLPSGPQPGDTFFVADAGGAFATSNLTISRNGMTINGEANDIVLNTNGDSIGMFWNGNTWRLYE